MIKYRRVISEGSILSIEELEQIGNEGWIMCAATPIGRNYHYLFYTIEMPNETVGK